MAVCYNKLFKILIDKKMIKAELANRGGFSSKIITDFKSDGYVSIDSIEKICNVISCSVDDILEFVPESVNIKGDGIKECCYDE